MNIMKKLYIIVYLIMLVLILLFLFNSTFSKVEMPSVTPYISIKDKPGAWETQYLIGEDGVPQVYYENQGYQKNPTTISQYALSSYDDFIETGNENSKRKFLLQVN